MYKMLLCFEPFQNGHVMNNVHSLLDYGGRHILPHSPIQNQLQLTVSQWSFQPG